jgi:hypothetical protein
MIFSCGANARRGSGDRALLAAQACAAKIIDMVYAILQKAHRMHGAIRVSLAAQSARRVSRDRSAPAA